MKWRWDNAVKTLALFLPSKLEIWTAKLLITVSLLKTLKRMILRDLTNKIGRYVLLTCQLLKNGDKPLFCKLLLKDWKLKEFMVLMPFLSSRRLPVRTLEDGHILFNLDGLVSVLKVNYSLLLILKLKTLKTKRHLSYLSIIKSPLQLYLISSLGKPMPMLIMVKWFTKTKRERELSGMLKKSDSSSPVNIK